MSLRIVRDLKNSQSGVALIEFALTLPMLMFVFAAMVDGANYLRHKQNVTMLCESVGHMVASSPQYSRKVRSVIDKAIYIAERTGVEDKLSINVFSLGLTNNAQEVIFEDNRGNGDTTTPPPNLVIESGLREGESVIFVKMTHTFRPMFFSFLTGDQVVSEEFVMQPNLYHRVIYTDSNLWDNSYTY